MQQYPYNSPLILTDSVFLLYGGQTGTSSAAQRQAAYLLAEEQMTEHLSCFLVPTIITGTHFYRGKNPVELEFGNITQLLLITKTYGEEPIITSTGSALIRNVQYGYIDVFPGSSVPYNVQVVYESGLATGTYTNPAILSALTLAAQINLNEWDVSLSNESTADIGVQQFTNQSYSEMRTKMGKNIFGDSAISQRVARLVKKYRTKPSTGLR